MVQIIKGNLILGVEILKWFDDSYVHRKVLYLHRKVLYTSPPTDIIHLPTHPLIAYDATSVPDVFLRSDN